MSEGRIGNRAKGLIKDVAAPLAGNLIASNAQAAAASHLATHAAAGKALLCCKAAGAVAAAPALVTVAAVAAAGYGVYKLVDWIDENW